MLGLLNILANERLKLKRDRLFLLCSFLAIALPVLMVFFDVMDKDSILSKLDGSAWVMRLVIPIQIIVFPVLSGFVLTFLVQKEYAENTIINTLTAPTNRVKFLLSKYIVWFVWFVFVFLVFLGIALFGFYLLFGVSEFQSSFWDVVDLVLRTGFLSLFSMSPLLFVCVLQRGVFYPSALFGCLVSGIGFSGLYWPELVRNVIPWSAVSSISVLGSELLLPYVSIFVAFVFGLFFSLYSFSKQDL